MQTVLNAIEKYKMLCKGDRVLLGLSGGADSVCLFHILLELTEIFSLTLICAHVNHGIRGQEANEDESFIREICSRYGVPLIARRFSVPELAAARRRSIEETGRDVRYACFDQIAAAQGCTKIAIAHNSNDNAETIFLNLCRGAGLTGLTGIPAVRGKIIRPLILTDRTAIEDYLAQRSIAYRQDSTNDSDKYTRNKIRRGILPAIADELGFDITEKLNAAGRLITADDDFLEETAQTTFSKSFLSQDAAKHMIALSISALANVHTAIVRRVIRLAISHWSLRNVSHKHIEAARSLMTGPTGKQISLPGGLVVLRVYDELQFSTGVPGNFSFYYNLPFGRFVYVPELNRYFSLSSDEISSATFDLLEKKFFKRDGLQDGINIRSRQPGDRIRVSYIGTMKLKDYFINEKIPREARNKIGVAAIDGDVLWILDNKNMVHADYVWHEGDATEKCCLQVWAGR